MEVLEVELPEGDWLVAVAFVVLRGCVAVWFREAFWIDGDVVTLDIIVELVVVVELMVELLPAGRKRFRKPNRCSGYSAITSISGTNAM